MGEAIRMASTHPHQQGAYRANLVLPGVYMISLLKSRGFSDGSSGQGSALNVEVAGDAGSIPGSGRSLGRGSGGILGWVPKSST